MSTSRVKLDIDPTIIERKLMIAESCGGSGELDWLFPKHEEIKSKSIQPAPGFCIKIKRTSNEKVFINVCHTSDLPAPDEISESALREILLSEACSNYRVPMSIGLGRIELDKQGLPANAYDIAINSNFLEKLEKSPLFKEFFVNLSIEAIEEKHKLELNRDTISILKHKKCVGTLQRHRVQQREVEKVMGITPKPLIQEISSTVITGGSSIEKPKMTLKSDNATPSYRFMKEPPMGPLKSIIGEIKLTGIISASEVSLDVGEDRLFLSTRGRVHYGLDVFFPHNINQEKVSSAFNKRNGVLTVNMPLLTYSC